MKNDHSVYNYFVWNRNSVKSRKQVAVEQIDTEQQSGEKRVLHNKKKRNDIDLIETIEWIDWTFDSIYQQKNAK